MASRPTPPNPNNLPDLAGGETVTNADAIVRYIPVGPRRLSLLQTAAYLTANGWTVTAPGGTPTITALTFASAGSIAANSPVNTVLGTLSYTATGGALVNPVLSLADNAGGKVKVAGNQVQLALGNVAQGTYEGRARIVADNAAAIEQDFSVTIASVQSGTTRTVGGGKQFATLAAAVAAAVSGDTINVDAGTYTNDFVETGSKALTINGVGGLAHFTATQNAPNGKAVLTTGGNVTLNQLEFSGATVADENGAGVRHEAGALTVTACLFHDNENGLLTGPGTMSVTVDGSEFHHNGRGDGQTHNFYAGIIDSVVIRNSYFHEALVGHEIKSRALSTLIEDNRIMSGATGTDSYSIDLPVGGNAIVRRNVIVEGANSQNPNTIHFGGEPGPHASSSLSVTGNTMVNDGGSNATALLSVLTGVTPTFTGNSLFGYSSVPTGNTTLGSRPTVDTTPLFSAGAFGPVTGLAAGACTTTSAPFTWTAVAGATAYRVEHRLAGASTWTVDDTARTQTAYVFSGQTPGSSIQVHVAPVKDGGATIGAYSSVASATLATASGGGAGGYAGLALDQGANYRWGYGAAETLAIPFEHKAEVAITVGRVITKGQEFGLGDVPENWRFYGVNADNSTFPIYSENVVLAGTETGRYQVNADLTWKSPVALAAGAIHAFTIKCENIAPDHTGWATPAQIAAALPWEAVREGLDIASPIRVALADIINGVAETPLGDSYGTNPASGWCVTKRNPAVVEIHGFGFFKRVSDGAQDAFQRAEFFFAAHYDGGGELDLEFQQPNVYGPHATGTIGSRPDQIGIISHARLAMGGTDLFKWGGTDGRDAFTVDAGAFNIGGNFLNLPADGFADDMRGRGCPVTFSGSGAPSGLTSIPGGVAYVGNPAKNFGRDTGFVTSRLNTDTTIGLGSAGSGACRVMPCIGTFPTASAKLLDRDARRLWVGPGYAPDSMAKHDIAYLTRRAAFIQELPLDETYQDMPDQRDTRYVPCTMWAFAGQEQESSDNTYLSGTGGVLSDDRLGLVTWSQSNMLVRPYDQKTDNRIRYQAAIYSNTSMTIRDERSGKMPVFINGPDNAGAAFPGMGPNNPSLRYLLNGQLYGSPQQLMGTTWFNTGFVGTRGHGVSGGYNFFKDPQHLPQFDKVVALRLGDTAHRVKMLEVAMACTGGTYDIPFVGGATLHGAITIGSRGGGWSLCRLEEAIAVIPTAWAEAAVLDRIAINTALFMTDAALSGPVRHLGCIRDGASPAYGGFYHLAIGRFVRRGRYPQFRAAAELLVKQQFDRFDDEGDQRDGVANAGAFASSGADFSAYSPNSGTPYSSLRAMIQGRYPSWASAPARSTGNYTEDNGAIFTGNNYALITRWVQRVYVNLRNLGLSTLPDRINRIEAQHSERYLVASAGDDMVPGRISRRTQIVEVPVANRLILGTPYLPQSGKITLASLTVPVGGAGAPFAVLAKDYPVWAVGFASGADVGARVQVDFQSEVNLIFPTGASATGRLYSAATGSVLLSETGPFTPGAAAAPSPTTRQVTSFTGRTNNSTLAFGNAVGTTGRVLVFAGGFDADDVNPGAGFTSLGIYHDTGNVLSSAHAAPLTALTGNGITISSVEASEVGVMLLETSGVAFQADVLSQGDTAFLPIPMLVKDRLGNCTRYIWIYGFGNGNITGAASSAGTVIAFGKVYGDRPGMLIELPDGWTDQITVTAVGGGYFGDARIVRVNVYPT